MTLTTRQFESVKVYLADELHSDVGDWTPAPSVFCNRLELRTLPEIDAATLVYHVGEIYQHHGTNNPGTYNPLATLARSYVRIRVVDPNNGDLVVIDWVGMIDRKSVDNIAGNVCNADQYFHAYGLAHELGKKIVTLSKVASSHTGPTTVNTIQRGIGFNIDDVEPNTPGNRFDDSVIRYFSRQPNLNRSDAASGSPCAVAWTPEAAMLYTLENDAPAEIQWTLAGQKTALNVRIGPEVVRDRRSVLEIVSDIIGRGTGLVAWISAEDNPAASDPTRLQMTINIASTSPSDIVIGAYLFPQNNNQISIDATLAPDFGELEIAESGFGAYDEIVYEGNWITTTATMRLDGECGPAWLSQDETDLVAADPDAANPNLVERNKAADEFRATDRFRQVFTTFGMHVVEIEPVFDNPTQDTYALAPDPNASINTAADIPVAYATPASGTHDIWRKPFLREIPNPDLEDNKPFLIFPTTAGFDLTTTPNWTAEKWTRGNKLKTIGGGIGVDQAQWFDVEIEAGRVGGGDQTGTTCYTGPGFTIRTTAVPWLIGSREMDAATAVMPQNDYRNVDVNGLAWQTALLTATIESDIRCRFAFPAAPVAIGNTPLRTKVVVVPSMRFDIALPGTVTGIDDTGAPVTVGTDGAIWRDDRRRLEQLAAADFAFSGPDHRTVRYSRELLIPDVLIGWMISSAQTSCGVDTVNTVVTSIDLDFLQGRLAVRTQHEEVNIVETFGDRAFSSAPVLPGLVANAENEIQAQLQAIQNRNDAVAGGNYVSPGYIRGWELQQGTQP